MSQEHLQNFRRIVIEEGGVHKVAGKVGINPRYMGVLLQEPEKMQLDYFYLIRDNLGRKTSDFFEEF